MSPNDPLREVLRGVLCAAVESEPGAVGGIGSLQCRVFATLYVLLGAHAVDGRGRCWSCRRPGAVFGFLRRHCRVRGEASVWLQQPEWFLRSRLISELRLSDPPPAQGSPTPTSAGDAGVGGDTDAVPRTEPDPGDPRSKRSGPRPSRPRGRPAGYLERDGRTQITAGSGSPPAALSLACPALARGTPGPSIAGWLPVEPSGPRRWGSRRPAGHHPHSRDVEVDHAR
ncbi:MAG: hypothetical protein ACRDRX_00135 [Pseudonocardiaceae bacterium]